MKKRILPILCLAVLCLGLLCPFYAQAEPLDTEAEASLSLRYQKDGKPFPELGIEIFRVARAQTDGSFLLIPPFSSYPINIYGITTQEQWQSIAATLGSYIVAEQVAPTAKAITDQTGTASFDDLETGLYFVREVVAEDQDGTYIFNQFLVYLPTPQPDGTFQYAVEAVPKCTGFTPKTQLTVIVLWKDKGYEDKRPASVNVETYENGVLQQTQLLSPENNWTYTWQISGEDYSQWSVAERPVPEGYKVTMEQNGSTFVIINAYQGDFDNPQTGDSFTPLPWIILICISGIALLILGIYFRRLK